MGNVATVRILAAAFLAALAGPVAAQTTQDAAQFHWRSSGQLIAPQPGDGYSALKDPTLVWFNGRWQVLLTTVSQRGWHMGQTGFTDWSEAAGAPVFDLQASGIGPGYRAAPQVFYFEPQGLWYMIYQVGPPAYSTTANIENPTSWSAPQPFFEATPDIIKAETGEEAWLDFWVICDETDCYLFNTDDHGGLFRSRTSLDRFPEGFSDTTRIMKEPRDDLFEASMHYRIEGTGAYLTVVEAIGERGRYFRAWTSDRLDGEWTPLGGAPANLFAGGDNVVFDGPQWSQGISHGELIRSGHDQTLAIDPCQPLRFLYQGLEPHAPDTPYIELPYRLGLLTAEGPNPISALCRTSE